MEIKSIVDALVAEHGRDAVRRALEAPVASDQVTVLLSDDEPPPTTTARAPLPERYEDLGLLGTGGMGEVRRVRDRELGRVAAMKLVYPHLLGRRGVVRRFQAEARVAAQLQHPGLVPVYDAGRLPDGRHWFTMREVRGRTLGEVIDEVHDASSHGSWLAGSSGWSLHRLLDAFAKVCDAVGYAHARGVLHRDLKPDNIMIGTYGEVLVLDWGIAKVLGRSDDEEEERVSVEDPSATSAGSLAGTASYMAPEQARGEIERLDPRTDVYGLGAVLYQILTGRPPFHGKTLMHVLVQVMTGPPLLRALPEPTNPLPEELVSLCERAMAFEMEDRYPEGTAVAADARAWLEGSRRRERALGVVAESRAADARALELRRLAADARLEARALLAGRRPWEPEDAKAPGWLREDQAATLEREAALVEQRSEVLLQGALQHDPDLPEAHAALVKLLRAAHAGAEQEGNVDLATRLEVRLRAHVEGLRADHPTRRSAEAWLAGDGALTLVTDPPGAEVELWRFEARNRRLVAEPVRALGPTPVRAIGLPMGSYLCLVRHPERAEVRYPVHVGRSEHWDGVPPGHDHPVAVPLPRPGDLGPDDRYVPPGWFRAGDHRFLVDHPPRRLWCDGFVARRFPVTNAEYLRFLDDLVARGREDDASRWEPRERAAGEEGAPIYGRAADGRFVLRADADGDCWDPDWPVVMVDWVCADAYAAWLAEREGLPWRLPAELEREKAARGVDGRKHPWGGEAFDPSWGCTRDSHQGRALIARVDTFPVDESPYGVRGCAGNTRDWCLDPYARPPTAPGDRVVVERGSAVDGTAGVFRGGAWNGADWTAKVAYRGRFPPGERNAGLGFRLVRSWP